jgi:trypsin
MKDSGGQIVEVTELIPHPRFDKIKLTFDFAILKFIDPIIFDEVRQPIELPEDFENIPDGTKCKVSGWGKMENEVKPPELRSVDVFKVNIQTCQNNYNTSRVKFRITNSMMCAGVPEGQKDACSGDSVRALHNLSLILL